MGTSGGLYVCVFLLCLSAIISSDANLQYRQDVDLQEGTYERKTKDMKYTCPTPVAPPNSYITGDNYDMGSSITVHCFDGYVLHGNREVQCVAVPDPFHHRVIWDNIVGHNPECVKDMKYTCPTPVAPPNSYITGDNYDMGSSITVHCFDGYVLHGNREVRCVAVPDPFVSVVWDYNIMSSHNPECVKVSEGHHDGQRLTEKAVEAPPMLQDMGNPKETKDEHVAFPAEPTTTISPKEICSLDSVSGPCKASMPRYYYDKKTKQCKQFTYGGCKGNGNRFKTEEECKKKCMSSGV